MICDFSWCEFYNILIGGVLIGIITSFLFVWLVSLINIRKFKRQYLHLQSSSSDTFDWTAYSMREDNGRLKSDEPNGSVLNVTLKKDRIYLKLKQSDSRIWNGELKVETFDYGLVTYKYENDHEYGKRECIIGNYQENNKTFDYIYLIPTNNKIYYIEEIERGKSIVNYNYGEEIFIRERKSS